MSGKGTHKVVQSLRQTPWLRRERGQMRCSWALYRADRGYHESCCPLGPSCFENSTSWPGHLVWLWPGTVWCCLRSDWVVWFPRVLEYKQACSVQLEGRRSGMWLNMTEIPFPINSSWSNSPPTPPKTTCTYREKNENIIDVLRCGHKML